MRSHNSFGSIVTLFNAEHEEYTLEVSLNFNLYLGNNFSYQHFIDALAEDATPDNTKGDFMVWVHSNVSMDDNLIIRDSAGKKLWTNGSDFMDHFKSEIDKVLD